MRKYLTLIIVALMILTCGIIYAKGAAEITFASTSHDFGRISASAGKVSCKYEFTNTGSEALVIVNVTNGGCGCTTPSFTREPIEPGKKGFVSVTFDPSRFKGEFNRSITVTSNAKKSKTRLKFSGYITD